MILVKLFRLESAVHTLSILYTLEANPLVPIVIAIVFAAFALLLSNHLGNGALWILSFLAAGAYYRQALPGFLIVSGLSFAVMKWLDRCSPPEKRWKWTSCCLLLLGLLFTAGRLGHWDETPVASGQAHIILYSLDMWMLLRLVTVFWEIGSTSLPVPSLTRYYIWMCMPFGFGGPLLRLSEFPKALRPALLLLASKSWWKPFSSGAAKMACGIALTIVQSRMVQAFPQPHLSNKAFIALAGPVEFYLMYAGNYQIMETLAALCGISIPRSFNAPFGRENISTFWANWNMTATRVFRDYLFYNRWGFQRYNPYVNTMILFVLVGLWHAANAYWILWGFLHGVFMCCFLIWRKYNGNFTWLPLRGTTTSLWAARIFTFLVVCSAWYLPSKILQKLSF